MLRTRRKVMSSEAQVLRINPVGPGSMDGLEELFGSDLGPKGCWCMWYIVRVADYHAAGAAGNRQGFEQLIATENQPVGLLAIWDDRPVGWCALGPRRRYARAIKTPTFAGRNADEDDTAWLIPCFFVHRDYRGRGISDALLGAAVDLSRASGARALEAFPHVGPKRRSSGDAQVGFAEMFLQHGFSVVRTPSPSRVVVRLELQG